ncbi:HEAT repeat-containing protein 1 isoform X2 [Synchiropus splendidus]|uniref:HEAT repeat-containing protein 1 isoform X2 n=1 Tax=Synchiropus splendidus TaxID=270530 RepID=UPI00237EC47E|nr:HEAT repeat-containing protein 1 isoform X2 [Synchiropus splendidus]
MTSLAQQLKRLALPQSDPHLLTKRQVASLLFDLKDAAEIDLETFHALGCSGLEQLLGIEPLFLEFTNTLFSSASMTLERSVQSKEVNKKLDSDISLFLTRLSPYFLLKPAHKCIEWLVQRFHVQLYNVDSLLACAFPYHHTNTFVRLLQMIKIKESNHQWSWLLPIKKAGVPLSRGALITHCHSDLSFLDFVCQMVSNAVQAFPECTGSAPQLRIVFSFYSSTIVPAVHAIPQITDSFIAKLLPYLQQGLRSPLDDYRAASYMLVSQLAVRTTLKDELVGTLAVQVTKPLLKLPTLLHEALCCLVVLLQSQRDGAAGTRFCTSLVLVPSLVPTLQLMSSSYDVTPLVSQLIPYLVSVVVSCSDDAPEIGVLESILNDVPLTRDLNQTLARCLLDQFMTRCELTPENADVLKRRLQPLVRVLENKYCGILDDVLAGHATDISPQQRHIFHDFLSLSVTSGKFQVVDDSDTTLLLSLQHPQWPVRVSALEHLVGATKQSFDQSFLRSAVLERLKDDVPNVVAAALKVMEKLFTQFDPNEVVSTLVDLTLQIYLREDSEAWLPVIMQSMRLLSDPQLGEGREEALEKAGWQLLPLLVVNTSQMDSPQFQMTCCIARSVVVARHPLTCDWAEELDTLLKQKAKQDIIPLINKQLTVTVTRKLGNMERLTKRRALEQLVQAMEQQRERSARAKPSFLVLTHMLLLSLAELRDTEHLLMAQRIYMVLEPLLMEAAQKQNIPEVAHCGAGDFCDALSTYLRRCQSGHGSEPEFTFVLISLLRSFVSTLRCSNPAFKGEQWWNPEKLDTNTCCYLGLICQLFTLLIGGAGVGPHSGSFRQLLKLLVQDHFEQPSTLFRFLCLLWGYGSNRGDQLDLKMTAVTQIQALYMGGALLKVQPAASLKDLMADDSPVIPSLLCCLNSPLCEVRRAALSVLQSHSNFGNFQKIIVKVLGTSEEIIADPSYLNTVLGSLHEQQVSLKPLLQSVLAPCCPSYTGAAILRSLSLVNGQAVLAELLPLLERLLDQCVVTPDLLQSDAQLLQLILGKYNEASAALLAQNQRCLDLFVRALRTSTTPHPEQLSCQTMALELISRSFFDALGDENVQKRLLSIMFDLLDSSVTHSIVGSVFKALSVDAALLVGLLCPPERSEVAATVQQSRRSRLRKDKVEKESSGGPAGDTLSWRRVTLILELLLHKKKLKRVEMLVPVLFSLLARSLEVESNDLTNIEYTKQLLLSCLLNICNKLSARGATEAAGLLDEDKFSVELVVQCVRGSDVPQTHHHALLLLGAAAAIFPDKVLHNIMSIFTFMGASVLRLDDAYSFRVIDKTVQMVIPALIKARGQSGDESSAHLDAMVTRILHVFVDARPHVPEHRQHAVLTQLLSTLGPAQYLWVLMLLLFKMHATQAPDLSTEKDAALERDMDFWISLCSHFHVQDQFTTLIRILKHLQELPKDKDKGNGATVKRPPVRRRAQTKPQDDEKNMEELIFSLETHSSKELRHFKFLSVSFMAQLLGSTAFIGQVSNCGENQCLQEQQQILLEEILRYIHQVALCVEENADQPTAKFWRALLNKVYDVLDKVNALLPAGTFITVMRGLMGNQLSLVRRKSMELLNNRLQHKTAWHPQQVEELMQLTGDLLAIVGKYPGKDPEGAAEHAINRQTALYSLKLLCRNFGSKHQQAFVPVLPCLVDIVTSMDEEKNVTGSALLCIAEVVSTLGALAISHLPRLMPTVLKTLTERNDLVTNHIYLLSAVTALQRTTETLPHFISPYLQDSTLQVCRLTWMLEQSPSTTASPASMQLSTRLLSLRSSLASRLPPRVLLPVLSRCYDVLVEDNKGHLGALMSILKEHLSHMERETLNHHQTELSTLLLSALDFRAQHCQGDLTTTSLVEGSVIDCLLVMVLKLSEVSFRPFFFKLLEWSKSGSNERLLTFFRLCDRIADRLKGLFVLFAGNLVKPLSDALRRTNAAKTGECPCSDDTPCFSLVTRCLCADEMAFESKEKTTLLLHFVLDCLHKILLYDTHHFLSKERAEALLLPLVDQLENSVDEVEVHQQMVNSHLVPCIGQFAVSLTDDSHWKTLNYQILLKTRHSHSQVRLSALASLMEVAGQLKENYMVLLPETIPFLAELMEDESEDVEKLVQKVIQEMENILGEPLQSYF